MAPERASIVLREAAHPSLALLEKAGYFGSFDADLVESVVYWTEDLFRRYGLDPHGPPLTLGDAWSKIHPDDQAEFHKAVEEAIRSGDTYSASYRIKGTKDDQWDWLQVRAGVLRSAEGEPLRLVGVVLDISPMKAAEAAQEGARDQVISLVESLSENFIALDRDLRFLYANAPVRQRCGLSLQELIGRSVWDVFPYTLGTEFEREYATVLCDRVPRSFEAVVRRPEGDLLRLDVHAFPTSEGMAAVVRDVTELRHAQDAWLASEERFRRAQQAANIGAFEWNLETDELTWAAKVPTFPEVADSASFAEYMQLVDQEDQPMLQDAIRRVLSGGPQSVEVRVHRPDGKTLWIQFKAEAVFVEGRPVRIYGVAMDVTDRKHSEEALRTTEKLAAAGRLAATIAHEVNNPLEAVMNLVYLAQQEAPAESSSREYLRVAENELARVSAIVRQTLGFFRSNTMPQPIDLPALAGDVLRLFESRMHARGISVVKQEAPEPVIAYANEGEVRQILANLIANSIDAMPGGGTLTLQAASDQGMASVQVGDTGCGISEQTLSRIFEPFFTTKESHGTGLGLWASRGLAEKNGGSISASSPGEGHGAEFTLKLPRSR